MLDSAGWVAGADRRTPPFRAERGNVPARHSVCGWRRVRRCASATSDSSPTGIALRSCRYASNCSAAWRKCLLRWDHRPPIRTTHSGTVLSAAGSCASSNGSPPRNCCFAHRLNQTAVPLERLNLCSHPRLLLVLRRARGLRVSSGQNPSDASISRLHVSPLRATTSLHPASRPPASARFSLFLIPRHPFRPMQST